MATMAEVRKWSDTRLVEELRNPAREKFPVSYTVLMAEAMARLLEGSVITENVEPVMLRGALEIPDDVQAVHKGKKGGKPDADKSSSEE